MKRILSIAALLLFFKSLSWAYDFSAVAPSGQTLYYNIIGENTVSVTWGDTEPTGDLTIPSMVSYNSQTYSVTSIGEYAFTNCFGITSVTIPNSLTSIGEEAFRDCSGLTSVTIPNSVTTIGEKAFFRCGKLSNVTIPNSVTSIGEWAFYRVKNLVYNGTATGSPWGSLCVNGFIEGNLIYTDSSKTHLAGCATTATSVTIPNSVTSIGDHAFYFCDALTSVTIPNSVISIGNAAFAYCDNLTSVTIPNSVTSIGESAFEDCYNLTSVTIPNSVTSIGEWAFYRVKNLVYNGTATGSPWGSLCVNGFIEGNLIYTDSSKTHLAGCATTATSVTIPNSVTSIGNSAFFACHALTEITSLAFEAPQLDEEPFIGVTSTIPVNIPCGCSTSYQSHWWYFSNFFESAEILLSAATADSTQGIVLVQTEPTCTNPTAVIFAAANDGYQFLQWNDGNTDNPRTIILTSDTTLIAYFASTQSIEDATDKAAFVIRTIGSRIVVEGLANETVRLFDCMGRCLQSLQSTEQCTFQAPAPGVYILQAGNLPAKRVVVVR